MTGRVGVKVDGLLLPISIKASNLEEVAAGEAAVFVEVGTSIQASAEFVDEVSVMVNEAYGCYRLSPREVTHRLAMGDAGEEANRVLHLAWRSGELVGSCSSTYAVGWAPRGCGHWGLLVVRKSAQHSGVGSALVAAAEARLKAKGLEHVQIEYDFVCGDADSERLHRWYEGPLGFLALSGRPPTAVPGDSEWRSCRKRLL